MEFDKDPGCFVNGCSPVESWFGVLEQADKAWPGKVMDCVQLLSVSKVRPEDGFTVCHVIST